jgi:hypothetical protein
MGDVIGFTEDKKVEEKKYILYVEGIPSKSIVIAYLDLWYAMGNTEPLNIFPNDCKLEVI